MFQICRPSNYGQQSNVVPARALLLLYCFVIDHFLFGYSYTVDSRYLDFGYLE